MHITASHCIQTHIPQSVRHYFPQVECLEREGVDLVFAYPGGASMEIHQALTRSNTIRNILCRHEQVSQKRQKSFPRAGILRRSHAAPSCETHP